MNKKALLLSALALLAMTVSACSVDPTGSGSNNTPSDSTNQQGGGDNQNSSSQQGGGNQSTSQHNGGGQGQNDPVGNFAFDESKLNTPQEIHTTNQKKYLNFTGEYYHITESNLTSFSANGNSDVSAPLQTTVEWTYTAKAGKTLSNFSFEYSQNSNMSDSYKINGISASAQKVSFYNAYLGDNYFKVTANLSDGSKEVSEVKVFKVDTQAPRNLKVGNMPNCRDMGGRTTYAGGKIKQGLIYRTAGNKFDKTTQVNDECKNVLLNQLKVKKELNVADDAKYDVGLSGITAEHFFMDYGQESSVSGISGRVGLPYSNLSRNAEKIRQVLEYLSNTSNYPVFYHCRIGTDRTGITGIILGGLLGIKFNEIFQDYCFSNFAPIDGKRYPNKSEDKNGDDPAKYVDEILAMPGKNFQEKTVNALLSIGVNASTINSIIDIMTEGTKAELPTTSKIGKGTDLTSTGTKNTKTDYSAPNTFYACSSGKETSYTATTTQGAKDIVVYLGSTDSSNTTKLASGISLKIDGTEKTIVDKTMFKAGFGTTAQTRRTAYMFQLLGKYDLSAGSHTFVISSKSGTFNVATICVFDHVDTVAL